MIRLKLSEEIIMLRRKKGITQDELAAFLGVTKASVSKWETKQSYPDILLLPQLAAYFNVSIDELLGYELQMSPEQIKKCYLELADDFAKLPFDEVLEKSRNLIKDYYSCYPLLMQIVILWINHFMLTPDKEKQNRLLNEAIGLCDHIRKSSSDVGLCSNAVALKAIVNLSLGNAKEVIEDLEPLLDTKQVMLQSDPVLIQAYQMIGDISKADLYNQTAIYTHLLNLVGNSIGLMNFHLGDQKTCEATIHRIRQVIDAYDLEHLHPNISLQFHYQTAVYYCVHSETDKALEELELFVSGSLRFIENGLNLHGDQYFDRIEEWFEEFALKTDAPRNKKVVMDSLIPALEHPALSVLFDTEEYKEMKERIERKKEGV
jgi:transcriptional regulator with XRE-family HTH domain